MKIIHTADWHLGKILNDYPLLEDQTNFIAQLTKIIQQENPDVLIIAGDIYDRNIPSAEAVSLLNRTLDTFVNQLHIKVIMTAGNHDSGERLSFGSTLLEQSGFYVAGKLEQNIHKVTLYDTYGPVNFYSLPYFTQFDVREPETAHKPKTQDEAFQWAAQRLLLEIDQNQRNVLTAHGFFAAVREHSEPSELGVGGSDMMNLSPLSGLDYIALGHIHAPQSAGFPYARYSGSPLKYSIDEEKQKKSISLITLLEKGTLTIKEIPIQPRRDVRTIQGSFHQLMEEIPASEDYVFVCLTDPIPVTDSVAQLKPKFPNLLGLKFQDYAVAASQGTFHAEEVKEKSVDTLFEAFYEETAGIPLTGFQKETLVQIMEELEEKTNDTNQA